jgi:hypothetical protein
MYAAGSAANAGTWRLQTPKDVHHQLVETVIVRSTPVSAAVP